LVSRVSCFVSTGLGASPIICFFASLSNQ
jgi:hypothetical protein